jgi:hypothetical protein
MVRAICELDGFASRARGMQPNKALHRMALRAAAEHVRDRIVPCRWLAVSRRGG